MRSPVTFSYASWAARYPELSVSVGLPQAQQFFNEAQLYCDNSPCSIIPNCEPTFQRAIFLNMLTAHIAAMNAALNGAPSSPLVGRVSAATEGSVNVSTQMDYPPGSPQWYQQTKYGAAFWAASASFRSMRYVPGPVPRTMPFGPGAVVLR